ncbi:MAG TPA: hypothetical protein VMS62_03560 [Gemmatimonadales bacterium]|jgi:hypothetical protein|nr:hypothetical protein [Gemmatimonadales bacterium]
MNRALLLLAIALSVACRREKAGNASASAYTSDADSSVREDGVAGTNSGGELEAPRLIPAMQNQLNLMANGTQPPNPDNLTAYKNMAGDLINSMIADLYRAGYADSGNFRALGDSVLDDLGGGAGTSAKLDRSKLPQHVDRMQRLIRQYQQTMRTAAERR